MDSTVIVTGGLGRSGRWIVDRLAADHAVVCVDLDHPGYEVAPRDRVGEVGGAEVDAGETFDLIGEINPDAVVHWGSHPAWRVFGDSVAGAYNVLVAAGRADATVVQASSESAYGFAFAEETPLPDELPITEDHPMRPEDPYGTGKVVAEEVADMVHRRHGIPVTSIRPSWIQYPGEYTCRDFDALADGAGNCWSYVDVRDAAELVASAVTDPPAGHEAVHAAAADNYLGRPTVEAVEEHFGALPDQCTLDGEQSALSTVKAAELFGWGPEHEWRTAREEEIHAPVLWS